MIYMPTHPRAHKSGATKGYVYEHIAIAEQTAGRLLKDEECVHHVDHCRWNNHPSNLMIMRSLRDHRYIHVYPCIVIRNPDWSYSTFPVTDDASSPLYPWPCVNCGKIIVGSEANYCSDTCRITVTRKVERPEKQELTALIQTTPMTAIGARYGVSDNAVRKWCRSYGIELPNRQGYWARHKAQSSST